jgi:GntR family transcriptional regulator
MTDASESDDSFFESGRPRHEQLSDWLREQIEAGTYETDDQLPSEHQLGQRFGVSRITVRRALQTLEHEGLIYRRQGLGSFVRDRRTRQGLVRLTDFAQDMAQAGFEASSRVLHHGQEPVPPRVAPHLGLEPDTTVARLDRLRLGDNAPIAFDRTWLPVFYAQLIEDHDLTHETIYGILEQEYEIPVLRGRYWIRAANAPADLAEALDVPEGRALLLIERLSLTQGDKPVYFQRRYYRSDRVAYELELERNGGAPDPASGMPLQTFEPVFDPSSPDDPPAEPSGADE